MDSIVKILGNSKDHHSTRLNVVLYQSQREFGEYLCTLVMEHHMSTESFTCTTTPIVSYYRHFYCIGQTRIPLYLLPLGVAQKILLLFARLSEICSTTTFGSKWFCHCLHISRAIPVVSYSYRAALMIR